ncbi:unnamed protein product [Alopecurus aequalis]
MKVSAFLPAVCGALGLLLLLNGAGGVESGVARVKDYHWFTMFMFGDSFVDTGNLPSTGNRSALSRQWHWPYGTYNKGRSGNPLGRFSNYFVQSDVIARILGRLMAPPAYKRTMKHYCDPSGMTFAVGGAGVYEVPEQLPTLAKQIHTFRRLIKDGSISKWHLADSVALVAISGNDYAHVANASDIGNIIAFIGNVTAEIAANVKRLQKLGVKKVLVNDLHPVGCTPWLTRATNYTACDARGNMAASFHNSYLRKSLAKIKNVHILDLNTAFTNIVNHAPGNYSCIHACTNSFASFNQPRFCMLMYVYAGKGSKASKRFEHKLTPCCESFDPDGYCGQQGNNSERLYTVCTNPEDYFYWDSVHPTMAGWEAVMKQLQKPMLHFLTHN